MRRQFHNLNRRFVPRLYPKVCRHLDIGKTHRSRVGPVGGTEELPRGDERVVKVHRPAVGPVSVEPDVDVKEGRGMAGEPARLPGEGAACCGPVGSVFAEGEAAAWGVRC